MSNGGFLGTVIIALTLTLMIVPGRSQVFADPQERVLWSFGGAPCDGSAPYGGLIKVGSSLYGTTSSGGANGFGTVFQLTPPAPGQTNWSENVLWSFGGPDDGANPLAGLIEVGGKLYGTTSQGGTNISLGPPGGGFFYNAGTVFQLTPPATGQTNWSERVLWSFGAPGDAADPAAGLVEAGGSLYGTTEAGGTNGATDFAGTVFQLTPPVPGQTAWSENVLWSFGSPGDGANPYAGLIEVGGKLYGTTSAGGTNNAGTVFEVSP